jgi:hypothetical protein
MGLTSEGPNFGKVEATGYRPGISSQDVSSDSTRLDLPCLDKAISMPNLARQWEWSTRLAHMPLDIVGEHT